MLQIASLLKDNERIQSVQSSTPSEDDSDIKKIKKVRHSRAWSCWVRVGLSGRSLALQLSSPCCIELSLVPTRS